MAHDLHPRVAWQIVGNEAVLIDLERGRAQGLNEAGTFLWSRIAAGSERDLAEDLAGAFDVDLVRARHDVAVFLADLRERGLLAE